MYEYSGVVLKDLPWLVLNVLNKVYQTTVDKEAYENTTQQSHVRVVVTHVLTLYFHSKK
jgi:hypothetical protein